MAGKCCGCGVCSSICPHNAIVMDFNKDGFYIPNINNAMCIKCGLCEKICAGENATVNNVNPIMCVSAKNRNLQELLSASSGGVSIELMRQCLRLGYKVVGVCYDMQHEKAITKVASNESDLKSFHGSKYFQSCTEKTYKEILNSKDNQRYAVFGTPCQIKGLYKYAKLQNITEKFLFIDVFCHGCPSYNLWKKYLSYIKRKYNIVKFDNITFRSKTRGWHEFCFDFEYEDKKYLSSKLRDPFFELFFSLNCMNTACYTCDARSTLQYTDIRLGDFWGWQHDLDTQGVSAVVILTNKGKTLFNAVIDKFKIASFSLQEIIEAQSFGKLHHININARNTLIKELSEEKFLEEIIANYNRNLPFFAKTKMALKDCLAVLPRDLKFRLKKHIHKWNSDGGKNHE